MDSSELSSDDKGFEIFNIAVPKMFLYESPGLYLTRGNSLLFHVTITVSTGMPALAAVPETKIIPPASDLMDQLGKIYASEDGCDVTFLVGEKQFRAHKIILAVRSPVFEKQLYGEMMESNAKIIEIKDMLPEIFQALLRYIYTDTLPTDTTSAPPQEDDEQMICGLLMAADLYDVERLKLLCEQELCHLLRVQNVAKMVAFAEDHHCDTRRDACIEFCATSSTRDAVEATEGYVELCSKRPLTKRANKKFCRK